MSEVLQWELHFLMVSFFLGIGLHVGYDALRILRLYWHHTDWWVGFEDVFFCLGATVVVYGMFFQWNHGVWRGFSFVAMVLGMWLWNRTLGGWLLGLIKKRRNTSKKQKKT